jgi:hypothetical protein
VSPTRTDSAQELLARIETDQQLQQQVQQDPVAALAPHVKAKALEEDRWIYRIVVTALGLIALLVVIGVFALRALDKSITIPDALVAIGSAAVAALAALLAPSPRGE